MKKFIYICALAAIAATALSCSKEKEAAAPIKWKTVSVELGCPQMGDATALDSKTALIDHSIFWKADDVNIVCITNGTKGSNWYLFTSDNTEMSATKVFTGKIPDGEDVVLYAYLLNKTSGWNLSKWTGYSTIRQILAYSQSISRKGGFNEIYNFAVAKPDDFSFRNCCGYLKWTQPAEGTIKTVRVETIATEMLKNGSNDEEHPEYMAGYFDCTYGEYDDDPSTVKSPLNTGSTVGARAPYVTCTLFDSVIAPDESYYMIVLPRVYHGIKVTITLTDSSSIAIKSTKTFEVKRGEAIDLGVLPVAALTKSAGSFEVLPGSGDFAEGWTLE